jgi:NAD(P)-dependent dehydrogenase (short-subunit alcohol dehydrogenase family)
MGNTLQHKTVVVVGRGSGIARAVTLLARSEGARVIVAGRDKDKLAGAYDDPGITTDAIDVTDDSSIAALADRVGPVDDIVSTASARARGKLAKYFAPRMNPGGSFVLFSGVNAFKVNVGYLGVAITNGAVDFLTRSLAVELAPIRVNTISPGVIDTGAWDTMGEEGKRAYFAHISGSNPAGRIGTPDDVADAVLFAMTNTFLTGVTLKIDGGEPLS